MSGPSVPSVQPERDDERYVMHEGVEQAYFEIGKRRI
jgi:hypothetical protein